MFCLCHSSAIAASQLCWIFLKLAPNYGLIYVIVIMWVYEYKETILCKTSYMVWWVLSLHLYSTTVTDIAAWAQVSNFLTSYYKKYKRSVWIDYKSRILSKAHLWICPNHVLPCFSIPDIYHQILCLIYESTSTLY